MVPVIQMIPISLFPRLQYHLAIKAENRNYKKHYLPSRMFIAFSIVSIVSFSIGKVAAPIGRLGITTLLFRLVCIGLVTLLALYPA